MTKATKLICTLIAAGFTSRSIILDRMETDLKCDREWAEDTMDNHRMNMEQKISILSNPSQRTLK